VRNICKRGRWWDQCCSFLFVSVRTVVYRRLCSHFKRPQFPPKFDFGGPNYRLQRLMLRLMLTGPAGLYWRLDRPGRTPSTCVAWQLQHWYRGRCLWGGVGGGNAQLFSVWSPRWTHRHFLSHLHARHHCITIIYAMSPGFIKECFKNNFFSSTVTKIVRCFYCMT